jgi:hypothetical protein
LSTTVRTQTRQTSTIGDPVPDQDWNITSDTGILKPVTAVQAAIIPSSQIVHVGDTITLDGSKSTGTGTLIYTWAQTKGTTATLSPSSTAPTITFAASNNTSGGVSIEHTLTFQLTVHDTTKASSSAIATVDIKPAATPSPPPIPPPSPPPIPPPSPPPIPPPSPPPSAPVKFVADVINHSSKLSNAQLQTLCSAIKTQLDRDGAPFWGSTAEFNFGPAVAGHAKLGVFDNSDQPGALGWHDDVNNQVTIEIFYIGTLADVGVTISHEMLETIGDYNANTTVPGIAPDGRACTYFTENCDPVESDVYQINGIDVSNFVTPAWFQITQAVGTPDGRFDFLKNTTKPFDIDRGGYMEISYDGGRSWSEVQARTSGMDKLSGSRKRMRDKTKSK